MATLETIDQRRIIADLLWNRTSTMRKLTTTFEQPAFAIYIDKKMGTWEQRVSTMDLIEIK